VKLGRWMWLLALVVGFGGGLTYAWVVAPLRQADTSPRTLRADFKDQLRTSIAAAYSATGDLGRARARLALLADDDPVQALTAQAQRALAAGHPFGEAQELALLASDLQAGVSSIPSQTQSVAQTNTPMSTPAQVPTVQPTIATAAPASTHATSPSPTATATVPSPPPTRTPMPSPSAPFKLLSRDQVCDPALTRGLLQVTVLDRDAGPLPGMEITITWEGGSERFFTGLQPELGEGYADYALQEATIYSVQVARLGVPVSGLVAPTCTGTAGQSYLGGLALKFQAP
jgi:hypothetical protein